VGPVYAEALAMSWFILELRGQVHGLGARASAPRYAPAHSTAFQNTILKNVAKTLKRGH